ncbi:MAG: 3-oxoacyl-ACP reductase FabG [Acidimicrobiales bacterium]
MTELDGRVALVTGGGRGIGRAISMRLADDGATVVVNYRKDRDSAEETVAEIVSGGGRAMAAGASVDDLAACEAMAASVREHVGVVDILVNNGGIASRGRSIADTEVAEFDRVVRTHAWGPFHLCKIFVPAMRTRPRGDVVMVSSVATRHLSANGAPYNVGKAAMEALASTLAKEERDNGIRVNVVAPGLVATDMGDRLAKAVAGVGEASDLDAMSPFGRVCRPEDVAAVVSFLVSADASYLTGQRIEVDGGGMTMTRPHS